MLYCRKCNYELSVHLQWDQVRRRWSGTEERTSERCPECGANFGKSKPVRGRSFRRRVLGPILLDIVVIISLLVTVGLMRQSASMTGLSTSNRWVSMRGAEWVQRENIRPLKRFIRDGDRVVEVDAATGLELREVGRTAWPTFAAVRLTPDGLSLVRLGAGGRAEQSVLTLDRVAPGGRDARFHVPLGFLPLGYHTSPFVGITRSGGGILLAGYAGGEGRLLDLDLHTGRIRTVHRTPLFQPLLPGNWVADRWSEPDTLVRYASFTEAFQSNHRWFEVFDFDGHDLTLRTSWSTDTRIGQPDTIDSRGLIAVRRGGERAYANTTARNTAMMELDLNTGDIGRQVPSERILFSPPLATNDAFVMMHGLSSERAFYAYDMETQSFMARARYPDDLVALSIVASRDGGRMAVVGVVGSRGGGANLTGRFQHVLVLYDFGTILSIPGGEGDNAREEATPD